MKQVMSSVVRHFLPVFSPFNRALSYAFRSSGRAVSGGGNFEKSNRATPWSATDLQRATEFGLDILTRIATKQATAAEQRDFLSEVCLEKAQQIYAIPDRHIRAHELRILFTTYVNIGGTDNRLSAASSSRTDLPDSLMTDFRGAVQGMRAPTSDAVFSSHRRSFSTAVPSTQEEEAARVARRRSERALNDLAKVSEPPAKPAPVGSHTFGSPWMPPAILPEEDKNPGLPMNLGHLAARSELVRKFSTHAHHNPRYTAEIIANSVLEIYATDPSLRVSPVSAESCQRLEVLLTNYVKRGGTLEELSAAMSVKPLDFGQSGDVLTRLSEDFKVANEKVEREKAGVRSCFDL